MLRISLCTCADLLAQPGADQPRDAAEAARLAVIQSTARKQQFLAGRVLARQLLSQAFGGEPADWVISCQPGEKPSVANWPNCHISISHSGDYLACVLADASVGIDIERPKPGRDVLAAAELA